MAQNIVQQLSQKIIHFLIKAPNFVIGVKERVLNVLRRGSTKKVSRNTPFWTLSASLSENMTVEELGQWLVQNGFSEDIRQCFERKLAILLQELASLPAVRR